MNSDIRRRLERLKKRLAAAGVGVEFAGSQRFWVAITQDWPPSGLTDAELAELEPLFGPDDDDERTPHEKPDPVEDEIRRLEAEAGPPA